MSARIAGAEQEAQAGIDWLDLKFAVCAGVLFAPIKTIALCCGNPGNIGASSGDIMSIVCVGYILWRAQHQPEKLREWGLTTPITGAAAAWFTGFLALAITSMAALRVVRTGSLPLDIGYVFRMVDYVSGAFPQQFLVFAIGVATLEKFPILRGHWRLPLLLGTGFSIAHFFMPHHLLWGVPVQVLATLPLGFFATYYFLRFRTILPLVAIHSIGYVLLANWFESGL